MTPPFDPKLLFRKKLSLRRELLAKGGLIEKRIAALGGSTTHDVIGMLELFLLDNGMRPVFYESEYAQCVATDMLFTSIEFLFLFLPVVLAGCFLLPFQ